MFNLILNENMKIYRRWGTWVMFGILVLAVIAGGFISKDSNKDRYIPEDWKAEITAELESAKFELENTSNEEQDEFYVNMVKKQIATREYQLEHNIDPFKSATMWTFVNDASALISLITLFSVVIGASVVSSEFAWGTIKLLLIRPVSRAKILLSKLLSTFLFSFIMLLVLFVISVIVGTSMFGVSGFFDTNLLYVDGKIVEENMVLYIWKMYGLQMVSLVMVVAFAFTISTLFKQSAMAIGISMFIMFAGTIVNVLVASYGWAKYLFFINMDLTQYISGDVFIEGMTMSFSVVMNVLYFVLFIGLSLFVFTKKDIVS